MKNLLIISSKKYLSKKISDDIFKTVEKNNIKYDVFSVESDSKNLNDIDPDLIISIGGDGTALKAMRVAWEKNTSLITIGPGRLGYLVSSSENLEAISQIFQLQRNSFHLVANPSSWIFNLASMGI